MQQEKLFFYNAYFNLIVTHKSRVPLGKHAKRRFKQTHHATLFPAVASSFGHTVSQNIPLSDVQSKICSHSLCPVGLIIMACREVTPSL